MASVRTSSFGRIITTGISTAFSIIDESTGAQIMPDAPSFSARTVEITHSSIEFMGHSFIL